MKLHLFKITRILDAQTKLSDRESLLTHRGSDWQSQRTKQETIDKKNSEFENKLNELKPLVTEEEFYEHFADRLCCSWEDFNNL